MPSFFLFFGFVLFTTCQSIVALKTCFFFGETFGETGKLGKRSNKTKFGEEIPTMFVRQSTSNNSNELIGSSLLS